MNIPRSIADNNHDISGQSLLNPVITMPAKDDKITVSVHTTIYTHVITKLTLLLLNFSENIIDSTIVGDFAAIST